MNVATLIIFIGHLLGPAVNKDHAHRVANVYAPIILDEIELAKSDIDPRLIATMIQVESSFDNTAISKKGAVGPMQIMPDNPRAKRYTVNQLMNVRTNIRVGLKIIEDSRKSCARIIQNATGSSDPRIWLSRYGGFKCQESVYADAILQLELSADNS